MKRNIVYRGWLTVDGDYCTSEEVGDNPFVMEVADFVDDSGFTQRLQTIGDAVLVGKFSSSELVNEAYLDM